MRGPLSKSSMVSSCREHGKEDNVDSVRRAPLGKCDNVPTLGIEEWRDIGLIISDTFLQVSSSLFQLQ